MIDVRTGKEFDEGHIAGSLNIPADDIRERLEELPKGKAIYIYCQQGLRGYIVHRILRQNGFEKVYNLSGGYALWKPCQRESELVEQNAKLPGAAV
ncbi:MAG TPA: rhodanese-like domain-containing protein [Chitinophagaceae bacterium]|nr:rhodanese-like domain-containing protein [Chitinophagaceae bacterium]